MVDYLGIHLNALSYIAILLSGLVIFLVIWIVSEIQRQKRRAHHHRMERAKALNLIR